MVLSKKSLILNNEVMIRGEDGFFQISKDKEAVMEFMKEVEENSIKFKDVSEKVHWMVDNDYYYDVYEKYSEFEVNDIFTRAYSYDFQFQSYMAISKFYSDYAVKTNDKKKYIERYEDRVAITSLYLADGSYSKALDYVGSLMKQCYQPATPTFLNAGKSRRGEMVSCFLLTVGDSLNDINFAITTSMQLSKIGGGVSLYLSRLRSHGEPIKGVEGAAKGVIPVMKLLEDSFNYADQMGQRRGSGAVYLDVFHWDIEDFLNCKKINADEKIRIATLSTGLVIPDKFFELAKEDKELYVFAPYSIYKEYGLHFDEVDMNTMYDDLVNNPNIKKRVAMSARDMLTKIASTQIESGYPYLFFKDNANKDHALKNIGEIKFSNLCTEIMQLSEYSEIKNYGQQDIVNRDISCNLGSINIVNVMEYRNIQATVYNAINALSSVSRMTSIENAPTVKKANNELRSVGLGAMNLHGFLAKNKISYESEYAIDFVRTFFMMMNYYSLEASMLIARQTGETFKDFKKSEYYNGSYFEKYIGENFEPKTDKVKNLFEGIYIPTKLDWQMLQTRVQAYGLYNAYRLTLAPTQSISYIQNATSSVMPITEQVETRTYANSTTYYPMPFMDKNNFFFYKSAYNVNQFKMIDLIAEIQKHVDQGISTTLFIDSNTSTRELARYYIYAWQKGLKSLYYTRTKMLGIEECVSCAV
jgi:ribonucleoside-diphosphate reductase alpha chain